MRNALEIGEKIACGDVKAVDIVESTIKRIEQTNKDLNAFITITYEEALKQAEVIDREVKEGIIRSPLSGVPVAIKDNICTKGIR
ncbi:MAG TPA: Asp-tRNA(Asn)/Glu-tRNA(Gln) amidotransferase subunit GatA, partial [Firmicutes bacterium]|nr:Asp-tRNA(Asn)/Glu-tRNA(Gln) amidotransferase subunit GatA [Bacillota bacterium]